MVFLKSIALFLVIAIELVSISGCSLGYVIKSGWYQAQLLYGAKSINKVLKSGSITDKQRQKLEMIIELRQFAKDRLSLEPGKNYTTVNMEMKSYIHVLSASDALAFKSYVWCFPIIGCVPYKGHFVQGDAEIERNQMQSLGYDVSLGKVDGYSSLGYFKDPVWATMLEREPWSLAELILHELAHRTVYFVGQSNFNENFANFTGKNGTLLYVAARHGKHSKEYQELEAYYRDEDRHMKYMWKIYSELDGLYKGNLSEQDKHKRKEEFIKKGVENYHSNPFETRSFQKYQPKDLNNAYLMTFHLYNSGQAEFGRLFSCLDHDFGQLITEMKALQGAPDPLAALSKRFSNLERDGSCINKGQS